MNPESKNIAWLANEIYQIKKWGHTRAKSKIRQAATLRCIGEKVMSSDEFIYSWKKLDKEKLI